MGAGVLLWAVGKQFLIKHVVNCMLPFLVIDPPLVPSDLLVIINLHLRNLLWAEIF
jgi:hypothetical protein